MNPIDLVAHAGSNPLFLLAALFLGALHGLEPGHSKGMMAAFIIGTRGTYPQAILLALSATLSHTAIVWILAWPASYGGAIWSSDEIMPYLNLISGIVILILAYWMLRRLNRAHSHHHHQHDHSHDDGHHHEHHHAHSDEHAHPHTHSHEHESEHGHAHAHEHPASEEALSTVLDLEEDAHARSHLHEIEENFAGREVSTAQVAVFGLSSGLTPCTAAIVILIICFQLHQPWLGMGLVALFSLGLGLTLTSVALLASWAVRTAGARSKAFQEIIQKAPFLSALVTASVGIYLIIQFFRANY